MHESGSRERWLLGLMTHLPSTGGYTKLGETEQALDLLERMLPNVGEEIRMWIKHDSDFAGLHDQPRFQKLLKSIV